jgi:dipeptidyl aminopeptidase/acylaminoacyl peptidase
MTEEFVNEPGLHMIHDVAELEPVETEPGLIPDRIPAVEATASWAPTVSPDGAAVAFVSDRSGEPRLWVSPIDEGEPLLLDTGLHPVLDVEWSPDGAWLAFLTAPSGAARTEVWIIRPDGRDLWQVAGFGDSSASFGRWSRERSWLTVAEANRHTNHSEAFLLDPTTGHRVLLGGADILAALDVSPDHRWALLRRGPRTARWLEVVEVASGARRRLLPVDAGASTDEGYFGLGGSTVFARTNVGRDMPALVAVALDDLHSHPKVVAERADAELDHVTVSGDGATACLLWNVAGGRSEISLLDLRTGVERPLPMPPRDVISWCDLSHDGSRLVFAAENPGNPRSIWRIDTATDTVDPVTYPPPHVMPRAPLNAELHRFAAHDGMQITGWLYGGRPGHRSPAVIYLHGGPEAQERPQFNPLFRSLVARGLIVFALNVRGSSGFGRAFVNADNLGKRYDAIADVATAVGHLVDRGLADPARIGCMGRSYGGYLTLAALVWYPDLFAVGVDVCGMADLETFYEHTEPWIGMAAYSKYGHPAHDQALLRDLSPLHRLDRLRVPLLVVHGAHDTNVPLFEAEQVVAALADSGIPCEFLLFRDEGHEVMKKANQAYFVQRVGDWLADHLDVAAPAAAVPVPRADAG